MTQTILTNPKLQKNRRGKPYLNFDIVILQDNEVFVIISKFIARRNANGEIDVKPPIAVTKDGPKSNVVISEGMYSILRDVVEKRWGEAIDKRSTFIVY